MDEDFVLGYRFVLMRNGLCVPVDRVESLEGYRILVAAMSRLDGWGSLAQTFGDSGTCEIAMIGQSDRARLVEITYISIDWLPFDLSAKSQDVSVDRVILNGVRYTSSTVISAEDLGRRVEASRLKGYW